MSKVVHKITWGKNKKFGYKSLSTSCGIWLYKNPLISREKKKVTCKKCLKALEKKK